jgi:hypothetical protein
MTSHAIAARSCGLLFVLAASAKAWNVCATVDAMPATGTAAAVAASGLVGLEMWLGVRTLTRPSLANLWGVAVVLASFTAYLLVHWSLHGASFRCACLPGVLDWGVGPSVIRNLALLMLVGWSIRRLRRSLFDPRAVSNTDPSHDC